MTTEVKRIMDKHLILSETEMESAIEFVRDLLELNIEDTEKNEPYATNSIREMKIAITQVMNLTDLI